MILSEWQEWKLNPQTIEFFQYLKLVREEVKEGWADSLFVGDSSEETIQRNAHALGQIFAINNILETTFEEIEVTKSESK